MQDTWFSAVRGGNIDAVQSLMQQCRGSATEDGETGLMLAVRDGNLALVETLAPYENSWANIRGETALMLAAMLNNADACRLLIPYETNHVLPDGTNALMLAAQRGCIDAIRTLSPHLVDSRDAYGQSALVRAVGAGSMEVAIYLVNHWPNVVKDDIRDALETAKTVGHPDLIKALTPFLLSAPDERPPNFLPPPEGRLPKKTTPAKPLFRPPPKREDSKLKTHELEQKATILEEVRQFLRAHTRLDALSSEDVPAYVSSLISHSYLLETENDQLQSELTRTKRLMTQVEESPVADMEVTTKQLMTLNDEIKSLVEYVNNRLHTQVSDFHDLRYALSNYFDQMALLQKTARKDLERPSTASSADIKELRAKLLAKETEVDVLTQNCLALKAAQADALAARDSAQVDAERATEQISCFLASCSETTCRPIATLDDVLSCLKLSSHNINTFNRTEHTLTTSQLNATQHVAQGQSPSALQTENKLLNQSLEEAVHALSIVLGRPVTLNTLTDSILSLRNGLPVANQELECQLSATREHLDHTKLRVKELEAELTAAHLENEWEAKRKAQWYDDLLGMIAPWRNVRFHSENLVAGYVDDLNAQIADLSASLSTAKHQLAMGAINARLVDLDRDTTGQLKYMYQELESLRKELNGATETLTHVFDVASHTLGVRVRDVGELVDALNTTLAHTATNSGDHLNLGSRPSSAHTDSQSTNADIHKRNRIIVQLTEEKAALEREVAQLRPYLDFYQTRQCENCSASNTTASELQTEVDTLKELLVRQEEILHIREAEVSELSARILNQEAHAEPKAQQQPPPPPPQPPQPPKLVMTKITTPSRVQSGRRKAPTTPRSSTIRSVAPATPILTPQPIKLRGLQQLLQANPDADLGKYGTLPGDADRLLQQICEHVNGLRQQRPDDRTLIKEWGDLAEKLSTLIGKFFKITTDPQMAAREFADCRHIREQLLHRTR
ncbi:Ankyrin repeat protein 1 [Giardia muris]|uniref:Ankyrin repeat protein 1 n=1 Tax=Giardia muris TaxID=5742 RepID=A0A4Z1SYC9_GIAMU|nr:Ankyrin repeat protein 1 [Giardia muris]|eukprot:TNJ30696.1 Ankyrin repeat protein 1 [Giardia muris]